MVLNDLPSSRKFIKSLSHRSELPECFFSLFETPEERVDGFFDLFDVLFVVLGMYLARIRDT